MSYHVFWNPDAEQQYAAIEAQSKHRDQLRQIVASIDRRLALDPTSYGESRADDERIVFENPLGILFEVMEDVKTVIVFRVWQPRK